MKPVMYLFVNRGLGMSSGKAFAQVSHAAVKAYAISHPEITAAWSETGETKVALLAEDEVHLSNIERYLEDRGYRTVAVIDEGRTEIRPHSFTALGVAIVDKDDEDVQFSFGSFQTYKDVKSAPKKRFGKGK